MKGKQFYDTSNCEQAIYKTPKGYRYSFKKIKQTFSPDKIRV